MKLPLSGSLVTITSNKLDFRKKEKSRQVNTMLAIKFFIYNPECSIPITYRLQWSLFKNMDWNKLIKKLHEITHKQYSGFTLTWNDGFHNCIITDVKDILRALEYMQTKQLHHDDCLHIKVNSLPKSLPNENVFTTSNSSKVLNQVYPPTYTEAIGSQTNSLPKTNRTENKIIIIRSNQPARNQ
ncbi:unnamed protein product [Schistosoma guineensis]|nr:unnamed protein product [Schistosoma guineensis]